MTISRLFNFQGGEFAIADDVDAELDQIITELNGKPDANGALQANLVAEYIGNGSDIFDIDDPADGGTNKIAVCNGTLQTNLDADTLDGLHASDFAEVGFPTGTALIFYQATPPTGWTFFSVGTYDQVLSVRGTSTANANGGTPLGVEADWNLVTGSGGGHFTVTIDGTQLNINQIPAHTHGFTIFYSYGSGAILSNVPRGESLGATSGFNKSGTTSPNVTSEATHTHTNTVSHSAGWRPPLRRCLIATKD